MHVAAINAPDLLLPLWRGTMRCDPTDDKENWDWVVLIGDVWTAHGKAVADSLPHLPGSFDRPPRNPAEKINTGYKAWEFLLYIFGLCPALLHGILPDKYWSNFCRLVRGIRLMTQHIITKEDLREAHMHLLTWERDFELLYYQRRLDHLHFIRPVTHAITHLATETRTIGNLGQEIRQPSNPYANLSSRAVHRAQVNALKAMIPDLEPEGNSVPRGAQVLGDGFILLRATERTSHPINQSEVAAYQQYFNGMNIPHSIFRWARLRLPNGQVARSAWKEILKPIDRLRMARFVKLKIDGELRFAEVKYYARIKVNADFETIACISLFSQPDQQLLRLSWHTILSCIPQNDIQIVDVKSILSVVAMVPHQVHTLGDMERYFVVEKPGLDVATISGWEEATVDDDLD
ncbi:hypothetical protein PAXINDRAFT_80092 [Paxillus involutus ATCC 200175]|uniref:Uncharacterized protein n=1 Tax=Paxillus involutus ATCC 200175 TaxID=664439 RepID=A0A0C9TEE3_PAXIN|nr:hypothetical protein PAXINDRAFT_80092 [Paxillus involutus ATCC 200175]